MLTCCARRAYYSPNAIKGIVPRHLPAVNPPREIFYRLWDPYMCHKRERSPRKNKVFDEPVFMSEK